MGNPDNSTILVFSSPSSTGASVPMPKYAQMPELEPWSVGLCDCLSDDCGHFCISFWCPCITFGQVAEIVDRGSSSCGVNGGIYFLLTALTGCGCIYSCVYRSKMRELFKLQGGGCEECLIHFCCEPCALTQMYRELQNRGFEVSLGWQENVQRQTRGVASMAPPTMQAGMNR